MREFGAYILGELLGKGLQGRVYKARHKETGKEVAIKFINKRTLTDSAMRNVRREIEAMQAVGGHKNVVQIIDAHWDATFPQDDENPGGDDADLTDVIAVVQEIATGGELFNYLMHTGPFDEHMARTYFRQLIEGLESCHAKGVTHRDIKAENILLDGAFQLKLADFGLSAKHEEEGAAVTLKTTCGTPGYMAPEILAGGRYSGPETDIWSSGILLFIMLSGFPPLQRATRGDWWYDRIRHKQMSYFWDAHLKNAPSFPKGAQALLDKIFVADPKSRATIEMIKEDAWFKGECYDLDDLAKHLSERKKRVDEVAAKEKAAKEAKKKKKRRRRRRGNDDFDAYGDDTYRGMGDGEEEQEQEQEGGADAAEDESKADEAAPAAAQTVNSFLFGKLAAPPADILDAAVAAAAAAGGAEAPPAAEATAEA